MDKTIEAIFENGVFRPLEPFQLPEGTRVTIKFHEGHPIGEGSCDQDVVSGALDELAALPIEGPDDGFSGAGHDEVLYGGKTPGRAAYEALARIAEMPSGGPKDTFCEADHDKILYGGKDDAR